MKKTYTKDVLRNTAKHKVSFVSVIIIAMLAAMSYLGILYSSEGIRLSSDVYFREMNLRDYEVTSTMLLTREDIRAIRRRTGVADAEGVLQVNAKLNGPGKKNWPKRSGSWRTENNSIRTAWRRAWCWAAGWG